ncbi:hypothetical protein MKW98_019143 [Papaver atlanticum]|uniref:Uncharacterized protein n=1 Tax=Papaver atlanticum TaxID=357466 RepID=A0AAD4XZC5_9MAGN|nr:hypothetical protein MKW98_019143 [Papaver atlanticum]
MFFSFTEAVDFVDIGFQIHFVHLQGLVFCGWVSSEIHLKFWRWLVKIIHLEDRIRVNLTSSTKSATTIISRAEVSKLLESAVNAANESWVLRVLVMMTNRTAHSGLEKKPEVRKKRMKCLFVVLLNITRVHVIPLSFSL